MPIHDESGYLFVNKPSGCTSSDLVIKLKKKLRLDSIGHTGTLDRFAEGLMIIPFGDYTNFSELFLGLDKQYYAEVQIGIRTDSGDLDGGVDWEWEDPKIHLTNDWEARFAKEILNVKTWKEQKAPKISALKVGGKRQSDRARKGEVVIEKTRPIEVFSVGDISFAYPYVRFRIHVSSGTYIRKIVLDLSQILGVPLVLKSLIREKVGPWDIKDSFTLEEVDLEKKRSWQETLPLPYRIVNDEEKNRINHGGFVRNGLPPADDRGFYLISEDSQEILAWCQYERRSLHLPYRYRKVFFNPSKKIMFSQTPSPEN